MLAGTDYQVFHFFKEVVAVSGCRFAVSADTGQKVTGSSGTALYLRVHSQKNANHPVKQTCASGDVFSCANSFFFFFLPPLC